MKSLTTGDKILVLAFGCCVIVSFIFIHAHAVEGSIVLIQVEGKVVHKASLNERRTIVVKGIQGDVVIETGEGRVAVVAADCPNHICIRTGRRSLSGEVIVCVPNRTIVRIVSEEQSTVRGVTG
jgi:hypothetical protein